ncbi:MAG: murein hydrolase activator EnvC family protein [Pseudomonadota bacterium]
MRAARRAALLALLAAMPPRAAPAEDAAGAAKAPADASAGPSSAASRPAGSARRDAAAAAEALRAAIAALDAARGESDRIAALTRTIGAYEDGLAILRESLRRSALREARIRSDWEARRARIGQVLGALAAMEDLPVPFLLAHPDGPQAAVRSGLLLSAAAPALRDEAAALARDLDVVRALRAERSGAMDVLQRGLVAAQEARTALSQAMQDRTDLPKRFLEDPEELRLLVAGVATLDEFASGLAKMESDIGPPMEDFAGAKGRLPLPVRGSVLRRAGEADAAGIRRPGLVIATRPAALVTAPWAATIRYRGPLLDYGNVMVLEPAQGYLMVLAGLGTVYGETGDVLSAGAPVGLMPGAETEGAQLLAPVVPGDAERSETLYLELRMGSDPLDPSDWFVGAKSE